MGCAIPSGIGHDDARQGIASKLPGSGLMLRRAALLAPLLIVVGGGVRVLRAQSSVQIRFADLGPGTGPSVLGRAVLAPYFAIAPAAQPATLRRDTTYSTTVIVLGRDAIVEGTVRGAVIVVGG